MSQPKPNRNQQSSQSRFPQAILAVSREEFYDRPLQLTVRDGKTGEETTLPKDLHGHFFIIGPAGSVKSSTVEGDDTGRVVWTTKDGWTPLYNGDGMIYRLSFADGGASLKTRLVKTPCYYADEGTAKPENQERFGEFAFQDLGITRISLNKLGIRNQLNTAFLPFKAKNKNERVLITWDVGRPYEIDPETLELLTPVGTNQDWEELLYRKEPNTFKQIMTSAHPVFDPETNELFTTNVGKSMGTMLGLSRSIQERAIENAVALQKIIKQSSVSPDIQSRLIQLYALFLKLLQGIIKIIDWIDKISKRIGSHDFVHLFLWDGNQVNIVQKWNVKLPGDRQIKIDQTVHQMGLTKDYITFAETSFKFSLENILPFQKNFLVNDLKILIADFIDYPQYPETKLYIIKREDLKKVAAKPKNFFSLFSRNKFKDIPTVTAKEVTLAPEFSHYILDYDNPNNQITLYVDHLAATDIAEYIRIFDRSAFDDRDRDDKEDKYDDPELTCRLQKLSGTVVSPMDVSRIGCWVIDGETGKIIDSKLVDDPKLTWSTAFYIYQDKQPTKKFTDIFWNSWGCWADTLSARNVEAYEGYPHRKIPVPEVLDLTYQGVPSSLCHLKIDRITTNDGKTTIDPKITDNFYQFDRNYLGTSSQFIPRPNAEDQTDGYIVSVVLTSDKFLSQSNDSNNDPKWSQNSEIWIFDARNLNQGPIYKLSHPQLNIGFTIHASWIAEAKSPERLDYSVREDFDPLIVQQPPEFKDKFQELFNEEVYPHFE